MAVGVLQDAHSNGAANTSITTAASHLVDVVGPV